MVNFKIGAISANGERSKIDWYAFAEDIECRFTHKENLRLSREHLKEGTLHGYFPLTLKNWD